MPPTEAKIRTPSRKPNFESGVSSEFIGHIFERITNAPLIGGNGVRLLIDATENYPAWLSAIAAANERIYFESYIIHDDTQGEIFAEALIEKAKAGVNVKLIYDWLGGFGKTRRRYWRKLRKAGIEVRCFNPPSFGDPMRVLSRDHRKCLIIDGETAFVSGLCVGNAWVGDEARNIPPWRDTGVQLNGPAVADVEAAFAEVWTLCGSPLEPEKITTRDALPPAGDTSVRIIQSTPGGSHVYRIDQLMASAVQRTMWLTDAYFIGVPSYLQSLYDAAADGVDVRILVPQSTDITIIRDTTRTTYRPLLEAGVRVFEWNGPMVHAKTAVFDGRFSRVGSTNLNIASWFNNYELDVFIESEEFGEKMSQMFLADLQNSTEILLDEEYAKLKRKKRSKPKQPGGSGSVRKATAGALNAATSISSAIANQAPLGRAEAKLLFIVAFSLLAIAAAFIFFPRIASIPLVVILLLLAIPTLIKGIKNYRN